MANFNSPVKVFIKSKNSTSKIINNYNISLIIFSILAILINLLTKNTNITISYIKSLIISLSITSIISYIINIIKKEYNIIKLYKEDSIISIAIIISLFTININTYIHIISIIVTLIIKEIYKKINISSVLYGILVIVVYKYLTNNIEIPLLIDSTTNIVEYLFNFKYLCPLLSIIAFIYLFYNKSIKYSLVFSYILTITSITVIYGLLNNTGLYYSLSILLNSGILFLTVYTLTDYKITPTISEGNVVYGIIAGILTIILLQIIPSLAILIVFILAPLLTNSIDKFSPKLKYNNKLYIGIIISLIALIILIPIVLTIIF